MLIARRTLVSAMALAAISAPLAPVADACTKYLSTQSTDPFLLVASFMNPHDICDWIRQHTGARSHPKRSNYPPAPQHLAIDPLEPELLQYHRTAGYGQVVGEHLHLVRLGGVEFDDGAAAEAKHLVDGHRGGAEHHHEVDCYFIEGWHWHSGELQAQNWAIPT